MILKHEGKEYKISQQMWDAMNDGAQKRGMTIDEYIAEAFTMLENKPTQIKDGKNN